MIASGDGAVCVVVPAEERLALLIDAVQEYAIFLLDDRGCVATWNRGAQRIKGYSADEIIGQHFSRFYTDEDVADGKPARELETAIATGEYRDVGWRVRKDGSRFWANVVVTALFNSSGGLEGFAKITRDETERVLADEVARTLQLLSERDRGRAGRGHGASNLRGKPDVAGSAEGGRGSRGDVADRQCNRRSGPGDQRGAFSGR